MTDEEKRMKLSAFVITLERAAERRSHVEWLISNVPWPCSPLSAVDGSAMTPESVACVYQRQIHRPKYPHALRPGEIGCFLSHRKAWQSIVDEDLDAALIFEDDVTFDPALLRDSVDFLKQHVIPGDYVQFQVRELSSGHPRLVCGERHAIVQPRTVLLRTTAQLVTREAALRLLEASKCFDRPVDTFLQMTWITGVPVKVILPRVTGEISQQLGGSTIQSSVRPWYERLRKEIIRPFYRAQIRYRARRAS